MTAGRTTFVRPAVLLTGLYVSTILKHRLAPDASAAAGPLFTGRMPMKSCSIRSTPARRWRTLAVLATAVPSLAFAHVLSGDTIPPGSTACATFAGPDPFMVRLVPTANANGASGTVDMRFADSPFGVTVTTDGHHAYAAEIVTRGLRSQGSALVVWTATPSLDQVTRLGALDAEGRLTGVIAYNKFLVFVTAEASADVERWSGPILLRGASPSARMHTMAGHGPFTTESCRSWGFGPGDTGGQDATR
jgi:hypothetical protein